MSDALDNALKQLGKATGKLNELTDRATDVVHQVEDLLGEYSVGITAAVNYGEPDPYDAGVTIDGVRAAVSKPKNTFGLSTKLLDPETYKRNLCSLEYRRAGKEKVFRFVVRGYDNGITPWDGLSRDQKLQAITAMPALIHKIVAEVESRVVTATAAIVEVQGILDDHKVEGR